MSSTQIESRSSPPNSGGEDGGISPKKRRKVNHGQLQRLAEVNFRKSRLINVT